MSSSRYPDSSRYPRERSPYRDRRASTYTPSGYPPRGTDSVAFPPRDVPRGPKSLVDGPRSSLSGPSSGVPSGPREGRGRGFAGRGDGPPSLRDAPPLTSSTHNSRDHWRADRDRDRDFRDRRPSPPRRSPVRDSRDFSLNIDRARRNSRDGPLSAGSTYSDPPLGSGSSYRGSGIGRGRGMGRDFGGGDFRPRGRGYHNDDRDRHHEPRDLRDRIYRPRSRSREPLRRDRDLRDDRDFDRRERDDRRFERRDEEPRRYDSYQGSASYKPSLRGLDTHRPGVAADSRNLPGTPTGPVTPHPAHHSGGGERAGPSVDTYPRRASVITGPSISKDARRESDQNDLIASRAEISKERYAPRASSPPASVPAFNSYSNAWTNPNPDTKASVAARTQKPAVPQTTLAPVATSTAAPAAPSAPASAPVQQPAPTSTSASASTSTTKPVAPSAPGPAPRPSPTSSGPVSAAVPAPVPPPPAVKPSIPSGLSTIPPTGPKADRPSDRGPISTQLAENKPQASEPARPGAPIRAPPSLDRTASLPSTGIPERKDPGPASQPHSPPAHPGVRSRPPPSGPQSALRPNISPSFSRPLLPPYAPRDASPGAIPSGPRHSLPINASPKSTPVNMSIPTGPKADRANQIPPRQPMYGPAQRPPFAGVRPIDGPHSLQWVRPGLNRQSTVPTKREFPNDDRDKQFGSAPKVPRLEDNSSSSEAHRAESRSDTAMAHAINDTVNSKSQASPEPQHKSPTPKPSPIIARRSSDVSMPDASPVRERQPLLDVPVPEGMGDTDDDFDLDEEDFAESEAKYNREKALLESKLVDLSDRRFRATTPLEEIVLLSNLSLAHLRQEESKAAEEDVASPVVQAPPESTATDLLTPKAEEVEDVVMEDKEERQVAPATRALRLRPDVVTERETTPLDVSNLPYLVSGPPTPLSDPDHDRPSVPDSVMVAIKDRLRKESAPETDPHDVMKEYAAAYKAWRLSVQVLDQERDQDEHEAPPYEPALKATTPDGSSASGALLDAPHTATGRRGHTRRFPTELDIEQVIKESLKTAEEERMGKKDKEQKILWDPEREAVVPSLLSAYEIKRRRFIDTNFQREPGQGVFVYHYEPPEDDFTEEEHRVMVQHYRDQYAKKWGKLAEILHKELGTSRTYKDTINHYYATKWNKEFKHRVRRRRVATARKPRKAAVERSDAQAENGATPLALTDSGRPRRQAAPTFGIDADVDATGSAPTPGRQRRQPDADGSQEKSGRRGKSVKEKGGRKTKNQPLAAAPGSAFVPSPVKVDRKDKSQGAPTEEEMGKRQPDLPMATQPLLPTHAPLPLPVDDALSLQHDHPVHSGFGTGIVERPRSNTNSRPGPSSYWSVTEQTDFQRNVAHFGTDWAAIANHMGTKTQTMVKNQYLRTIEGGSNPELARLATEADKRRERGEDLGPPPTPTPAPKRRYDNPQTHLPRTLAPTPEGAELSRSPSAQPTGLPSFSPTHPNTGRFSSIAQAPQPPVSMVSPNVAGSIPDTPLAALPSKALPQPSPTPAVPPAPQRTPNLSLHNVQNQQHKPPSSGPRAGYFLDDPPLRAENRLGPQQPIVHAQRPPQQQQLQPHVRSQEPLQPLYRTAIQQDRETQARLEQQQELDLQSRYQQHARRISQEASFPRQYPPSVQVSTQALGSLHSTSSSTTPQGQMLQSQQSRYAPPHSQPHSQPPPELTGPTPGSMAAPLQLQSRSSLRTPPVKEEPRHYPLPPSAPHSQQHHQQQQQPPPPPPPPQAQTQPSVYGRPTPPITPASAVQPPPKPAAEPKKSSLLSLLNDVPEEPKRKKPMEAPSHTPTPQQQTPLAPPPPSANVQSARRDYYSDAASSQSSYGRSVYSQPPQQAPQQHPSSGRQMADHPSEQHSSRHHPRDSWQQRSYQPGQSSTQQAGTVNSPHAALAQPSFGDSRVLSNHRALLAQHNGSRPSPPPINAYNNSPHLHSRTSSLVGPPSQQSRHSISGNPPAPPGQPAAGTSQILQPNPYAQVDPPGGNAQPVGPGGMRPSPHHPAPAQQRDMQRNEQAQMHNANVPYSGPQTPSEHHSGHLHLRNASISEQYRSRDARDYRYEPPIADRDSSRELSERADFLLREQREGLMSRGVDLNRGYPTQRSRTPLSRSEHAQHAPLQHPVTHSMLPESRGVAYVQRSQEEPPHHYREAYPPRDDRLASRMREEQVYASMQREEAMNQREREFREREMRERERYGQEMMRRDSRLPGPPPPPPQQAQQAHHEQRASHGGPMDWTSAVPRGQERWQQHQR